VRPGLEHLVLVEVHEDLRRDRPGLQECGRLHRSDSCRARRRRPSVVASVAADTRCAPGPVSRNHDPSRGPLRACAGGARDCDRRGPPGPPVTAGDGREQLASAPSAPRPDRRRRSSSARGNTHGTARTGRGRVRISRAEAARRPSSLAVVRHPASTAAKSSLRCPCRPTQPSIRDGITLPLTPARTSCAYPQTAYIHVS
jgi:hypothetical protein